MHRRINDSIIRFARIKELKNDALELGQEKVRLEELPVLVDAASMGATINYIHKRIDMLEQHIDKLYKELLK